MALRLTEETQGVCMSDLGRKQQELMRRYTEEIVGSGTLNRVLMEMQADADIEDKAEADRQSPPRAMQEEVELMDARIAATQVSVSLMWPVIVMGIVLAAMVGALAGRAG